MSKLIVTREVLYVIYLNLAETTLKELYKGIQKDILQKGRIDLLLYYQTV